jgi:hypothetical protein
MIDLTQLARIATGKFGDPPNPADVFPIARVVVLCEACKGEVAPAKDEHCECGNTGFDWTYTADLQAMLRGFFGATDERDISLGLEVGQRVVTLKEARGLTHDGRKYWPAGTEGIVERVSANEVRIKVSGGWSIPYRLNEVAIRAGATERTTE